MILDRFHGRKSPLWKFKKCLRFLWFWIIIFLWTSKVPLSCNKIGSRSHFILPKLFPTCSRDCVDTFKYIYWLHRTFKMLEKHSQTKLRLASKWERKYNFLGILSFWINFLSFRSALFLPWNRSKIILYLSKIIPNMCARLYR